MSFERLYKGISRRKHISLEVYNPNPVRVNTLIDLILLGIGSSLSYGIYFLIGIVAQTTGPAILISILIAGISASLAALCYVEFTARLPTAGSPYFYTYIQINEFMAFLFGWNMILEYTIASASFARGLSSFLKFILFKERHCFTNDDLFACYKDYKAVFIILFLTLIYTWNVKLLPKINDVVTVLNIIIICVILVAGFIVSDTSNWSISPNNSSDIIGEGGFLPFGVSSVLFSSAKYFYLFIGFGCITVTADQITNPELKIPIALGVCLGTAFILHMLIAVCLTLMVPYYSLDPFSPITEAFMEHNLVAIKVIVTFGAILAITNAIFCCQLPVTRTAYTMGIDGLICRCLGKLNERTKTPANATIFCGCVSAIGALIFDTDDLIELASLATLSVRCLSAMFIIMIHYRPVKEVIFVNVTCWRIFKQLIIYSAFDDPNMFTVDVVFYAMVSFAILSTCLSAFFSYSYLFDGVFGTTHFIICGVIVYLMIHTMILMARQPKPIDKIKFKVPCTPFIPCLSILLNILLMIHLRFFTWLRFIFWMILGLIIYFYYGITESSELTGSHRNLVNRGTQYEDPTQHPVIAVASRDSQMISRVEEMDSIIIDLDQSGSRDARSNSSKNSSESKTSKHRT